MNTQDSASSSFRQIAPKPSANTKTPKKMPGIVTAEHSLPQARKRSQHPTACLPCRSRKSKCDGVRSGPCGACARRGSTCVYELAPGETRQGKLQKENDSAQGRIQGYEKFFEVIRRSSDTEAMDIFKTLRTSSSASEAIQEVLASSILMTSTSPSRRSSAAERSELRHIQSSQQHQFQPTLDVTGGMKQPRYSLQPIDLPATAGPPSFGHSSSSPTATMSATSVSPVALFSHPIPAPAVPYGGQLYNNNNVYDNVPRGPYYASGYDTSRRLPSIAAMIPEQYISPRGKMPGQDHYGPRQI